MTTTDDLQQLRKRKMRAVCPSWCHADHAVEYVDALPREADDGWSHVWWESPDLVDGARLTVLRYETSEGEWPEAPTICIGLRRDGGQVECVTADQAATLAGGFKAAADQLRRLELEIGLLSTSSCDVVGEYAGFLRAQGKGEQTIHDRVTRLRLLSELVDLVDASEIDLRSTVCVAGGKLGTSDYTLLHSWFAWLTSTSRRVGDPTADMRPVGRRTGTAAVAAPARRGRWFTRQR